MNLTNYKVNFLLETVNKKEMSDVEYFSDAYKGYSSNSKLSYINPAQDGSPQKYRDGLKSSYNSSFDFGSAVHALFLQPNDFVLSDYSEKPTAKLGVFVDEFRKFRLKGLSLIDASIEASVSADYYSGKLSDKIIKTAITKSLPYYLAVMHGLYEDAQGREVIVLSRKQQDDCKSCIKNLNSNPKLRYALFGQNFFDSCIIYNEDALFVDVNVTLPDGRSVIIPLKSKLDNYRIDPSEKTIHLNDLKTSAKNVDYFMGNNIPELDDKGNRNGNMYWIDGSFQKYHYARQLALYLIVLQMYCKSLGYDGYSYKVNVAVVQSLPDFNTRLHNVPQKFIAAGMTELKELLCRVAFHELNGYDVVINEEE